MKILLLTIVAIIISVSAQVPEPQHNPIPHSPEPQPHHQEPEPSPVNQNPEPSPNPQGFGPEPSPYPYGPQPSPEPIPSYIYWIELGLTIAAMVFGALWVFFGYRLVRIVFFLAGAVLFFFITFSLLELYATFALWIKYVIAGGAALAGGLLLIVVLKIGFFIFGALTGMTLALLIIGGTPLAGMIHAIWIKWTAVGGAALLCAILAVIFEKPVTIVASSISGSYLIFAAADNMWIHSSFSDILSNIFNGQPKPFDITDWKPYALIASVVALSIIGIVTQALLTARNYHHDPKKQEVVASNIQEREAYPLLSKPY